MAATKARDSAGRALSALGARLLETSPRKRGKITGKNLSILILDVHRSDSGPAREIGYLQDHRRVTDRVR